MSLHTSICLFFFSFRQGWDPTGFYMSPALPFHLSLLSALTPCHPVSQKMRFLVCSFCLMCIQSNRKKERQTEREKRYRQLYERQTNRQTSSKSETSRQMDAGKDRISSDIYIFVFFKELQPSPFSLCEFRGWLSDSSFPLFICRWFSLVSRFTIQSIVLIDWLTTGEKEENCSNCNAAVRIGWTGLFSNIGLVLMLLLNGHMDYCMKCCFLKPLTDSFAYFKHFQPRPCFTF